jgi:hypothetical protein
MRLFATDLKKGMVFRYDAHWLGPITAEVIQVGDWKNGVMVQTNKGPIALDFAETVTLIEVK